MVEIIMESKIDSANFRSRYISIVSRIKIIFGYLLRVEEYLVISRVNIRVKYYRNILGRDKI